MYGGAEKKIDRKPRFKRGPKDLFLRRDLKFKISGYVMESAF